MDQSIVTALKKQSITIPTNVQRRVIPEVLKNKDLIVRSQTGTGKTLAYLIPIFEMLKKSNDLHTIILVPTHELAAQVHKQIEFLSQNSDIKVRSALIIGNVNIERQISKLKEKPQIIVGSAGRILELIKKRKITAHTVKSIIIDEADRLMLENTVEDVKAIIKTTLRERQIMMFSATISSLTVKKAEEIMKEPEYIEVEEVIAVPDTIEHIYFVAEERDKVEVLRKLLRIINPERAIVFAGKSDEIEIILSKLLYHKFNVYAIHGANIKLDRKKALDDFKSGKVQILLASDIAARGLDIRGITHVFNLNAPEDPKAYVHRVGRTGRAGNSGVAVSIVSPKELLTIKSYKNTLKINMTEKALYEGKIVEPRKRKTLKTAPKKTIQRKS
jgi:superfamily II DNA/RNA helicase